MSSNDPPWDLLSRAAGRAARSNRSGRFEPYQRVPEPDGWDIDPDDVPRLRTSVSVETPRRIITRNHSPDISFDRSINPYRGCEHGCIYCFARPSHSYLGLSPGLDFETRLTAKPDAPELLRNELLSKRYKPRAIAFGTNTDAYQPIEREHEIMRGCLRVLQEFRHPLTVVTKGTLVERDADILGEMGQAGLARVAVSITTLDAKLARSMEPRVPSPTRRLRVLETLSKAGCPVMVSVAPMIPGLTDHEVEAILSAARDAGATHATMITLRLPLEVSALFQEWLQTHRPDRAGRVMARIREAHDGEDYNSDWGTRMTGTGLHAELVSRRFEMACKRLGMGAKVPALRTDLFRRPLSDATQPSLF